MIMFHGHPPSILTIIFYHDSFIMTSEKICFYLLYYLSYTRTKRIEHKDIVHHETTSFEKLGSYYICMSIRFVLCETLPRTQTEHRSTKKTLPSIRAFPHLFYSVSLFLDEQLFVLKTSYIMFSFNFFPCRFLNRTYIHRYWASRMKYAATWRVNGTR